MIRDQLQALPSLGEICRSFLDLGPEYWMMLAGACLWLIILRLSLTGIDRRDQSTSATYVIYMLASGVTLVIALPGRIAKHNGLGVPQLVAMVMMLSLSILRFYWRRSADPRSVMPRIDAKPTATDQEGGGGKPLESAEEFAAKSTKAI